MGTSCKGHTLPLALAAMLVALAMLRSVYDRASSLAVSWGHALAGAALEDASLAAAASAAPSPGRCVTLARGGARGSGQRLACYESLSVLGSFPAVQLPALKPDFDAIFSRALPCSGSSRTTQQRSFTSPVARTTCAMAGKIPPTSVSLENIRADSLIIAEPVDEPSVLLATPGTLEVQGSIELPADTLILSGGDATIGALVASKEVSVSVFSAKGSVTVQRLVGPVSLVVIGAKSLRAPVSPVPAAFPLPPLRPPAILSVIAPDGSGK